jgi:hypothetical protein
VAPWSSPRLNFATPSRCPSTRRTLRELDAITFRTCQLEPTLGSRREWHCPNQIAQASPSTDSQYGVRTKFPSRRFVTATAAAHLCNFFCKLGAVI